MDLFSDIILRLIALHFSISICLCDISFGEKDKQLCDKPIIDSCIHSSNGEKLIISGENVWQFKDKYGLVTNAKPFKPINGVIKPPFDAVFTFDRGLNQDNNWVQKGRVVYIKNGNWYLVNIFGEHVANGSTNKWRGWVSGQPITGSYAMAHWPQEKSEYPLITFIHDTNYSLFSFKYMNTAFMPFGNVQQKAVVKPANYFRFLEPFPPLNSGPNDKSIKDVMNLKSTLGLNDGSFVYFFGDNDKYCKVSTEERKCEHKSIRKLLHCPTSEVIPTEETKTSEESNETLNSNTEEVSESNDNIGFMIICAIVLTLISIVIVSVIIVALIKRKDKTTTTEEKVETKVQALKKDIKMRPKFVLVKKKG